MIKFIIAAGLAALALAVSACGSTEPMKADNGPDTERITELRGEVSNVADSIIATLTKGENGSTYDACVVMLPKVQAKLDRFDNLLEKLDDAGESPKEMRRLRKLHTSSDGMARTLDAACSNAGL